MFIAFQERKRKGGRGEDREKEKQRKRNVHVRETTQVLCPRWGIDPKTPKCVANTLPTEKHWPEQHYIITFFSLGELKSSDF